MGGDTLSRLYLVLGALLLPALLSASPIGPCPEGALNHSIPGLANAAPYCGNVSWDGSLLSVSVPPGANGNDVASWLGIPESFEYASAVLFDVVGGAGDYFGFDYDMAFEEGAEGLLAVVIGRINELPLAYTSWCRGLGCPAEEGGVEALDSHLPEDSRFGNLGAFLDGSDVNLMVIATTAWLGDVSPKVAAFDPSIKLDNFDTGVPEPHTVALVGLGLLAIGWRRWQLRQN
jgi:PEP-CTERM motif-containing protein